MDELGNGLEDLGIEMVLSFFTTQSYVRFS